jgi:predicted transposase/invertase (TIGR01784 family)
MALGRYLNPKFDITFKRVFGTEKNKKLLIGFLNEVLKDQIKTKIKDVTFIPPSLDPELISRKQSVVDVLCKDDRGVKYIIEMQFSPGRGFEKRAQFYAAKAYIEQMQAGDKKYVNLKEVIFIAIADYNIFPKKKHFKSEHVILDRKSHEQDLNMFSFTFINLPKFAKEKLPANKSTKEILKSLTLEEKWYYCLYKAEDTQESDLEDLQGDELIIKEMYHELDKFGWSEEELATYDTQMKRRLDEEAIEELMIEDAEQRGMEKGKLERNIEIARYLLVEGIALDFIVKATGLTEEEIKKLQA